MKQTLTAAFAATVMFSSTTASVAGSQASIPMDKRDFATTSGRDEATEEWLQSWHKGEVYATQSEYLFAAMLTTEKNETPSGEWMITKWLKRWFADVVVDNVPVVESGSFTGKSLVKTFVYHEQPRLRMLRDYQYVMSDGTWGGSVIPNNQLIREALGAAVRNDAFSRENRQAFYFGVEIFDPVAAGILAEWGEAGWEVSAEWLKENVGQFDSEGRLNLSEDSVVGKAFGEKERRQIMAKAVAFSQNVNGRKIAIATDGKYSRRVAEIKSVKSVVADPRESVEAFDSYLNQGDNANADLEARVKRESFSVTSDLFDSEVRKPGDIWVVDSSFFNAFLHPDLKGSFRGTAVVKYVADEEGDNAYFSAPSEVAGMPKSYAVRKIEVLPQGLVNGAMVSTDLVYDERPIGGRFWAKYDRGNSNIFVLVDKASGHVVYSKMDLNADDVGALPSLALLDGFKAAGRGTLQLTFTGEVFTLEELSGSGK